MIRQPPWYKWAEDKLEPSWPLMIGIAAALIGITVALMALDKPVIMAAWLTYLIMP
jgi:hypothetical protein